MRRDYQDGRLDADDWREQRRELEAERVAAEAEVARLREQEGEVAEWARALDAERDPGSPR